MWVGYDDQCRSCGEPGDIEDAGTVDEKWFVVGVRGYRFHQPGESAPSTWVHIAREAPDHVPDQPARDIPDIGMTIAAQKACVELCIRRLRRCAETIRRVHRRGRAGTGGRRC